MTARMKAILQYLYLIRCFGVKYRRIFLRIIYELCQNTNNEQKYTAILDTETSNEICVASK